MKKFLPALTISLIFTGLLVLQMAFNGQSSRAQKTNKSESKYAAYESIFSKISVKTTKGRKLSHVDFKDKVVLFNFWASWCRPCVSEFITLNKLIKVIDSEKFLVLGINNDDEDILKNIKKTEKKHDLKFESINDSKYGMTGKFLIEKIPATIVFQNGKVIFFSNEEYDFMSETFIYKIKSAIKSIKKPTKK